MRRLVATIAVVGAVTLGTASATSLGLTDTTVFAADTILIAECTVGGAAIDAALPVAGAASAPLPVGEYHLTDVVGCVGGVVDIVLYGDDVVLGVIVDAGPAVGGTVHVIDLIPNTVPRVPLEDVTSFDLVIRDAEPVASSST